ncbi:dehydrodolichyl diphosphate synthase 2 [Arachis duranensis]|uniref:Alkyl transferase n=1 Tax=Arachis duranensis TaxID=130453 RepID=A0A6P4B0U0_ARADU|nr:dehydrodolichyl diphosphate synthase 2 [Arachis duranensis]
MFSLRLPIPIENTLITPPPKSNNNNTYNSSLCAHSYSSYSHSQTNRFLTVRNVALQKNGNSVGDSKDTMMQPFPEELNAEPLPRHVAVIMDGNGRWAKMRNLMPSAGHQAGAEALKEMVRLCASWGIKVLTVFAFSTDNWVRPKVEVDFLMSLFEKTINSEIDVFIREGIRISVIGDASKLPSSLIRMIKYAEERTKENSRLQLIVAVSYSGKYDVVQACRSVAKKVKDGILDLEEINEGIIEQELETNCTEFPNPDLLIRTSGELRVSNFLLWQLAYTELYFDGALWPDFGKEEFVEALSSFQQRKRRFGGR